MVYGLYLDTGSDTGTGTGASRRAVGSVLGHGLGHGILGRDSGGSKGRQGSSSIETHGG